MSNKNLELMKAISLVKKESYRLMAWIAITICNEEEYLKNREEYIKNKEFWITFDTLKEIMKDYGYEYSEDANRGLASSITGAYNHYRDERDRAKLEQRADSENLDSIRRAIAITFRDKDGNFAYDPEK